MRQGTWSSDLTYGHLSDIKLDHHHGQGVQNIPKSQDIARLPYMSLVLRKPVFGVNNQVHYKPGCTATEDGQRLEISDLESRGIVLSV